MNAFRRASLWVALLVCGASQANASVLFESAVFSNISNPVQNAWCSSCSGSYQVFDTFSLGASSSLGTMDFAIQSSYGSNWTINVSFWTADRSTNLYSLVFASGAYTRTSVGDDVDEISVDLGGLSLAAGTYWVSWYDSENMGVPGYSDPNGVLYQAGAGEISGQSAAFLINGSETSSVPEPGTVALLALGLGLGGMGTRRKTIKH